MIRQRLTVVALVIAAVLVLWFGLPHVWHWIEVHTGTVNESGPYYGFWSGFGSDIGEVVLIGGIVSLVRHHNCHVKGCWSLGRPVDGTPFVACHTHHPDRDNGARNVTEQTIVDAHARRKAND